MKKKKSESAVKLLDVTRLRFAVEVEVEFPKAQDSSDLISRHRLIPGWEMDFDGSLDNGAEYRPRKSNHLYYNQETLTQLKEILALIRVHEGRVNSNCGLHIHINCKGFTDREVLTIIQEFVHKQRYIVNKFKVHSVRLKNTCKLLPKKNLYQLSVKQIHHYRALTQDWNFSQYNYFSDKYYSLNITHLSKGDYGTLEFRLFNATLNYSDLKDRILWTLKFIKSCIERD